jgi:hypothetical protein
MYFKRSRLSGYGGLDLSDEVYTTAGAVVNNGNEPFGSVKSGEFLVQPMEFSHLLHVAA